MPKIPEVETAEKALTRTMEMLSTVYEERALLQERMKLLDEQITSTLRPFHEAVAKAEQLQKRYLASWDLSEATPSRYQLVAHPVHPTEKWQYLRAWLVLEEPERWTLHIYKSPSSIYGKNLRVILDPRKDNPDAAKPTLQELLDTADRMLVSEGFILTDQENS